jgi:hypothetical protein
LEERLERLERKKSEENLEYALKKSKIEQLLKDQQTDERSNSHYE